jgi:hypothetical protein
MDQDLVDLFGRCFIDHVEALFRNPRKQRKGGWELFEAPVVGGWHPVYQFDDIKNKACRAHIARVWWTFNGPSWSWPLPLSHDEMRNSINSNDPRQMLVGYFANSLRESNYDFRRHPAFADYCSGLMASPNCPPDLRHRSELQGWVTPRLLPGFDDQTLCAFPPDRLNALERIRRVKAELDAAAAKAEVEANLAMVAKLHRTWAAEKATDDCRPIKH